MLQFFLKGRVPPVLLKADSAVVHYHCRFCKAPLAHTFVDLGMSPLCESYVSAENLQHVERFYPLHVFVCDKCFLVQLLEYVSPQHIFSHYAYFSSYSDSWLAHAKSYTQMIAQRLKLSKKSRVIEIASNDGYLLQYFAQQGIPTLGIEPAANVAEAARAKGIDTIVKFFGRHTASDVVASSGHADLLVANNVLAHVPDINDFVGGAKVILAPAGTITMEFPHLLQLIKHNQFDTIYHEHFSYLSLHTTIRIFAHHGLTIYDVEELGTHGGSLRIYARHAENGALPVTPNVAALLVKEREFGLLDINTYRQFDERVQKTKRNLLAFLIEQKKQGKRIAGYGAPGKGNTLLNYCGIRSDFIDYTVDRNPFKQGKFLPGTRIPIHPPEQIARTKPDLVMILPWNLKDEIAKQLSEVREWGGWFFVPIPEVAVF